MTSKGLRRLAADHASLHRKGLPPNYLWPLTQHEDALSDLTTLTLLLAGPEGTPFAAGVYHLTLNIPSTYPTAPPTARFTTKIFHPNVDPATGAVCVETLKRDWKPELTLRDILVTVGCLLVFPNAASALNAEAGRLVAEDWEGYERKAGLWARMHAPIPLNLREAVDEARKRGEEESGGANAAAAGPGPSALEKRRRKERETDQERTRKKTDGDDVFVRQDEIQNTPPPKQFAAPPLRGLGIDMHPDSSLHVSTHHHHHHQQQLETPTQQQPPAHARRRKQASSSDEQNEPAPIPNTSFTSTTMPTPTPTLHPLIHSNPSTPRLGRPEPKRRRLTPEEHRIQGIDPQKPESVHLQPQRVEDEAPWLHWQERSPFSSPEDEAVRRKRRKIEVQRLERVGGSVEMYNAGVFFGPRLGVGRL